MIDKYIFGTHHKLEAMQEFIELEGLTMENIAFIGDELNDVKLLSACGLGIAVGDAAHQTKEVAQFICDKFGGAGAFREAVEKLLELKDVSISNIIQKAL